MKMCASLSHLSSHRFASSSAVRTDPHMEEVELVRRGRTAERNMNEQRTSVGYAVAPVRQDDTLMTIALRYGCKVAHLKQLNRMIGDQDVFGLRTIRIPAQHHGIVEELVKADTEANAAQFFDNETRNSMNTSDCDADSDNNFSDDAPDYLHHPLLRQSFVGEPLSLQGKQAAEYLHGVDKNVKGVVSAVAALRASNDTIDASVSCRRQHKDSLTTWGFDCGIRWSTAIIIVVVVGVAVPVALLFYYWFKFHTSS